jgi:uncharacterized protein CbrC (UPF0167 family)
MELPKFKYHPDPVSTGSIVESEAECACCGKARGYVNCVLVFADKEYDNCICPWCIADGSAHEKLGVTFIDEDAVGGYGDWDNVPKKVIAEITQRTPAFNAWQSEQWWTHCGDAAQFLGLAGRKELEAFGPDAVAGIKANSDLEDAEWDDMYAGLSKDGSPTAYLFRCSKCRQFGGFWDCD